MTCKMPSVALSPILTLKTTPPLSSSSSPPSNWRTLHCTALLFPRTRRINHLFLVQHCNSKTPPLEFTARYTAVIRHSTSLCCWDRSLSQLVTGFHVPCKSWDLLCRQSLWSGFFLLYIFKHFHSISFSSLKHFFCLLQRKLLMND